MAAQRKKYIERHRKYMTEASQSPMEHFTYHLINCREAVYYFRAIKEEFGVDIEELIDSLKKKEDDGS